MGVTDAEIKKNVKDAGAVIDAMLEMITAIESRNPVDATMHVLDAQTRINALAVQLAQDRADSD